MDDNSKAIKMDAATKHERKADPLPLRSAAPKASARLNKKTVYVTISCGAFVLFVSLMDGFTSTNPNPEQSYRDERRASLGNSVKNLPSTYADIRKEPNLKTPRERAKAIKPSSKSSLDKYIEEIQIAKLKEATRAHKAAVTFSGLNIPNKNSINLKKPTALNLPQLQQAPNTGLTSNNPRDEYNRQDDKYSFLNNRHIEDSILNSPLLPAISPYEVKAGSVVPGILLTGINSDLPGKLLAQVSQNIFDSTTGQELLVPQGTKVIGEYDSKIVYGQERVLIVWTRLMLPNGKAISLEGMPGVDLSGNSGLSERVNNHYSKLLSGVVLGSLIGAGAQIAQGQNKTINPSFEQLATEGIAQNINQAGQQITERNLNIQPTIEVSPGHKFNIFVTRDIILEPYKM